MKGILLAGGTGSRLHPLNTICNKHLLPVYDRPMIYYGIQALKASGIENILLVTGGEHAEDFVRVLGNGEDFGVDLSYRYQKEPGGIAQAMKLCERWANSGPVVVMLGDNIFQHAFPEQVKTFYVGELGQDSARIFTYRVANPECYGVVEIDESGDLLSIEEKPAAPKTNDIAVGLYFYNECAWGFLNWLRPSARGELEITDLNRAYLDAGYRIRAMPVKGWWLDAGESIDAYTTACCQVRERGVSYA